MKEVGGVSLCFLLTAGGGKGGAEGKKEEAVGSNHIVHSVEAQDHR